MYKSAILVALATAAVLYLGGCELVPTRQARASAIGTDPAAVLGYGATLRGLDSHIASMEQWTRKRPDSWPDWEGLANDYRRRAQLSGSYDDYAKAQAALESAFRVAPKGSGPFLSRAKLNFTMHRIYRVEPDLAAAEKSVILKQQARSQITAMRADVAYCSGKYAEARAGFQQALEMTPSAEILGRMADLAWQTGDFAEARQRLEEAEAMCENKTGSGYAVLLLQRGSLELDAGNTADAARYFDAADKAFPGWWLVAEHRTPLQTAKLEHAQQVEALEELAGQTGRAEDMDQVAQLYIHMHKHYSARKWIAAAAAIYRSQLKQFPEATYGHAVDHFLNFEENPSTYIDIAKRNVAARPMGSAKVRLAQAYLKAGQPQQALAEVEAIFQTPYNTTELHATAARIYAALGRTDEAATQVSLSRQLNPNFDPNAQVLGHSHH